MADNILHIPIQINGGTTVPTDLLERELFIKDGVLYVGTGTDQVIVIGRVVPGATITNPTINGPMILGDNMVVTAEEFEKNKNLTSFKKEGRIVFIDEGNGV